MLPKDVSLKDVVKIFEFASPLVLILHGSAVSKKRHTPSGKSDLDIICVTRKAAFWPLQELYDYFYKKSKEVGPKIDLSILSWSNFRSTLSGDTSLSVSLNKGFTLLDGGPNGP